MDIFSALAEPRRREIIELLAHNGQMTASDISDNFHISSPAVSQHLKVLRLTDLVEVEKQSQKRIYRLNLQKVDELETWVLQLQKSWEDKFDKLDKIIEDEKAKLQTLKTTTKAKRRKYAR
ncbi:metalloregulator ArsR/SmtB family transcription factor [Patescibacteria group bacterium]|nr:metalloregulator ArsR/SmtB family transcription factor [Patescibacteria group bacterium]MCL5797309.1 metalloregulator ArsR/SmtB family transcription factor [Patescibacteria group bacterium]